MAVLSFLKKKAKKKAKPKLKKKIARKKIIRKKIIKKKPLKRKVLKKKTLKKKIARNKVLRKPVAKRVKKPTVSAKIVAPNEEFIGKITHYFPHVKAAVIEIAQGGLNIGDTIHIKGQTTDFKQKITSMQIDHVNITSAKKGDDIGLMVKSRVRIHDDLYKLL